MKTKILITAAVLLAMAGSTATAESLPLKSVNKANEVIDAAIEAHGGAEALDGLTTEVIEKLERTRPATLGQASRIPGMTPAAIANLLVYLSR